jgi:hypothetical protein
MAFFLLVLCVMAFTVQRKHLILIFLLCINFTTAAQRLYIAGVNFPLIRIVLIAVLLRLFLRREQAWMAINRLDKAVLLFASVIAVATSLRDPGKAGVVFALSNLGDILGFYFVARLIIRSESDVGYLIKCMMWISFIIAAMFIYERITLRNPMGVFGGVTVNTWIRDGKPRVQGPYAHPILSGAYWAAFLPLFAIYMKRRPAMKLAMLCCGIIVFLCASSTPMMSLLAGIAAGILYYQRAWLSSIKLSVVAAILLLAVVWSHPIWYLFIKIDFTGGSTGYFRYLLTDAFVRNWKDWLIIGEDNTAQWGAALNLASVGLADITNQFILYAVRGGIVALGLSIYQISLAFKYLGELKRSATREGTRVFYWQLGVSLLVHIVSFFGVAYFGMIDFTWWMTLAICSSLRQVGKADEPAPAPPLLAGARASLGGYPT